MSERWQQEIAETVFDAVNQEADKTEAKRRQKAQAEGVEENCEYYAWYIQHQRTNAYYGG